MRITFFIIALTGLLSFFSCKPGSETQVDTNKHSLGFQLVKYNHSSAVSDLGTGLWAWPLPMDYDQDGDLDLVVSCPDVPFNGTWFFENPTGEPFPVFKPPVKIGEGHKNIQLSYVNGQPVVTVGSTEYPQFLQSQFEEGKVLFDAADLEKQHQKIRFKQWKWVDYENDGDMDLIVGMDDWGEYGWDNAYDESGKWTNGPLHGYVYLVENIDGDFVFKGNIEAEGKPIDVYGAPSPNFADFDGDGDLDLICGEFIDKLTWFENIGSRTEHEYAGGRFLENQDGPITMDLQMIIPTSIDWDKDGDIDLIVGDEDGRVAWIENTGEVLNQMPVFASPRYFKQEADNVKFGALVTPFSVDWDDDGDEDLICGNTAGYIGLIENLDGGNPPQWAPPVYLKAGDKNIRILAGENGSIQGPCEAKWGYTTLSVADWNGDQLKDIIVNSIWGKVIWYENTGTKKAPKFKEAQPVLVDWAGSPPKPKWNWWNPQEEELSTQWRTTPFAIDWNQDKLTDLIMLDHEGYLALFERFEDNGVLKLHSGKHIFYSTGPSSFKSRHQILDSLPGPLRLNGSENGGSGRRKFCLTDWDGDGDYDLLVNSESIHFLENVKTAEGKIYFTDRGPVSPQKLAGHTTSPTTVDWDQDGVPDLLVGAEDGHFYYYKHQDLKTSGSEKGYSNKQAENYTNVKIDSFPSKYVSTRSIEVLVPVNAQSDKSFPVLYMFDGQNIFYSFRGWGGEENKGWRVDEVLDSLFVAGTIPQVIVVGIFNSGQRMSEYMPSKPTDLVKKRIEENTNEWYDSFKEHPPVADRQLQFIVEELKPYIDANFRTRKDQANTFIAGSSMGGLISAYAICEYPDIFGGAACFSTHWLPLEGVFLEYLKDNLPDPATHKIYFDHGTEDLDGEYEPFQKIADQAMKARGYEMEKNWITRKFEGAKHHEDDWHARFHIPMEFLLGD